MIKIRIMTSLEAKISKRVHEFDLISLLQLLNFLNYRQEDIQFRSHDSIVSQPCLIHGIKFRDKPRHVVIYVNFGLLSAQTPLPAYFRKEMASDNVDDKAFIDFIGYFDHHLIWNYLLCLYPEKNPDFFPDWGLTIFSYLQMLNLRSPAGLHWLFRIIFPELDVQAEKCVLSHTLKTTQIKVGKIRLGSDAVFGRKINVPINGNRITVFSDDEQTDTGAPWPREIKKRLKELIFPVLRPVGINLEIILVIRTQKRWARLHSESYLGYDRIQGGREQYRRIRIFRGGIAELLRHRPEGISMKSGCKKR